MGGNALKQHEAVRLQKAEYEEMAGACINRLRALYPASSFFNRDIYLLKNRNAKSRVRDSKRPSYMKFIDKSSLEGIERKIRELSS